jgi:hypothetical protein
MSRGSIFARLKRLEAFRDESSRYGIVLTPRDINETEWDYYVQSHFCMLYGSDAPCAVCGYPLPNQMIGECLTCGLPEYRPQPPLEPITRRWGVESVDDIAEQASWLHDTQRQWCEQHGIGGICTTCRYPMAKSQTRCLVCLGQSFLEVSNDGRC